jgi:hypothetical protein
METLYLFAESLKPILRKRRRPLDIECIERLIRMRKIDCHEGVQGYRDLEDIKRGESIFGYAYRARCYEIDPYSVHEWEKASLLALSLGKDFSAVDIELAKRKVFTLINSHKEMFIEASLDLVYSCVRGAFSYWKRKNVLSWNA